MSITDFPDLLRITAANLKPSYPADTFLFVENTDGTRSMYFTDKTGVPRECGRSLQKVIEQINVLSKSGYSTEGQNKIIPNTLFIGGDYNVGKWGCIEGQTGNMPPGVVVGSRETIAYDVNNIQIRITEHSPTSGRIWINSCVNSATWTGWQQLVTTEKTEIDIPYNPEYKNYTTFGYNSKIVKTQFNQGRIYFSVCKTDGTTFKVTDGALPVAPLPTGFAQKFGVIGHCGTIDGIPYNHMCGLSGNVLWVRASTETIQITGYIDYEVV